MDFSNNFNAAKSIVKSNYFLFNLYFKDVVFVLDNTCTLEVFSVKKFMPRLKDFIYFKLQKKE